MSRRTKISPSPSPSSRARPSTRSMFSRQNASSMSSPSCVGFIDRLASSPSRTMDSMIFTAMSAACVASSRDLTDSPRKSSETLSPWSLSARAACSASSSVSPATKRMAKLREIGARVMTFLAVLLSLRRSRLVLSIRAVACGPKCAAGGLSPRPPGRGCVRWTRPAGRALRAGGAPPAWRGPLPPWPRPPGRRWTGGP